jgi:hypothetical protein
MWFLHLGTESQALIEKTAALFYAPRRMAGLGGGAKRGVFTFKVKT